MKMLKWMLSLSMTFALSFNAFAIEGEDYSDLTSDGKQILSDESLAQELESIEPSQHAGVPDPNAKPASAFTGSENYRKPAALDKKMVAKAKAPKEPMKKPKKDSKKVSEVKKKEKGSKVKREVASSPKNKATAKKSKHKKSKSKKS